MRQGWRRSKGAADLGRRRGRGARPDPSKGEEEELLVRVVGQAGQLELLLVVALGCKRVLPSLPGDAQPGVPRILTARQPAVDVDALAVRSDDVEPAAEKERSAQRHRSVA
jgi:hypothetical protein